jgi:hypothetical protein
MKSTTLLQALGFCVMITVCFAFSLTGPKKFKKLSTFEEVSSSGAVSAQFTAVDGHSGDCVIGQFKNRSGQPQQFMLEPGRRLLSNDAGDQDILITREVPVILAAGETAKVPIYGFCTQAHNSSPDPGSHFTAGYMVSDTALALSRFLALHDFPELAEQNAIWAVSDNYELSRIHHSDMDSVQGLLEFVSDLKGIPFPKFTMEYVEDAEGMPTNNALALTSRVKYEVDGAYNLHIVVYDKYGIGVQRQWVEIAADHTEKQHGYTMPLDALAKGHYYVKIYTQSTEEIDVYSIDV